MKVEFDEYGYLRPYEAIKLDLETFQDIFVVDFQNSNTREKLFMNYHSFLETFKQEVLEVDFVQWIDGSFVTKKQHPQDIDIVTLIDNKTYELKEKEISYFQSLDFYQKTKIDCYFLRLYPENNVKYVRTKSDLAYWENQFSFAKKNKTSLNRSRKGFIQLNF